MSANPSLVRLFLPPGLNQLLDSLSGNQPDFQPTQPQFTGEISMPQTEHPTQLHVADPVIDDVPPQPLDLVPTKALPSIMPARFAVDRGNGAGLEPLRGVESMEDARALVKKQVTMGTSPIVHIYELVGAEMAVQASTSLTVDQLEAMIKSNATALVS